MKYLKTILILTGISAVDLFIIIMFNVPPIWAHCIGWIGGNLYCIVTHKDDE